MSGHFVSLEGVEGSGKSTLARGLAAALRERGREVVELREPGATQLGERIRAVVLDPGQAAVEAWSELFLMLAARAQLVGERIRPALDEGSWILCDRFADASTAYQGYGRGLGREVVERLNEQATGGCMPALSLLVDLDPQAGRSRQAHAPDRMEREDIAFHERVREGYLEIAAAHPGRFVVLDGQQSPSALLRSAFERLRSLDPQLDQLV